MSADSPLKARITEDMKSAMRAGDKSRLGTIRMVLAAIKQVEVDTREALDESQVLAVLDKMVKQCRESIAQFREAGRDDLAEGEERELEVIRSYMPEPLSEAEITAMIDAAIASTGAASIRDMGRVMGELKPRLQGRADMAVVSGQVKARLG
jgi:uncharacterized protein